MEDGDEDGSGEDEKSRVFVGFVTISGSAERGLRVVLPKSTALQHGFKPGDVLPVHFDSATDEFVLGKAESVENRMRAHAE